MIKDARILRHLKNREASSLIWSMMMSVIIILIVSSLLTIVIKAFRQTQGITSSVRAYMAAEFASERSINYINGLKDTGGVKSGALEQDGSPSYSFQVWKAAADCPSDYCFFAQGRDGGVIRRIEGRFNPNTAAQGYVGSPSGNLPSGNPSVDYYQAIPSATTPGRRFILRGDFNINQVQLNKIYEFGILNDNVSSGWGMGLKLSTCNVSGVNNVCIVTKKLQARAGSIYGVGAGDGNPYVAQGMSMTPLYDPANAIALGQVGTSANMRFELVYRWTGQPANSTSTLKMYTVAADGSLTCRGILTVLNYGTGDAGVTVAPNYIDPVDVVPRKIFVVRGSVPPDPPWFDKPYIWDGVKKVTMYNIGGSDPLDVDNFWWQNY